MGRGHREVVRAQTDERAPDVGAPGDLGRRTPSTRRVEQVSDQLPLLIGQGDREAHGGHRGGPRCQL